MADLREIGPSFYFAPPRTLEVLLTRVMIRMEDAGVLKRKLFHYFIGVAKRYGEKILNGEAVPLKGRLLYWLGNILVYGPLKNVLGFSRVRIAYTAGEAVGPDLFAFYRSIGLNLKQLYGQTEAFLYLTAQPDGEIYSDTVGRACPNVDIRIADNGEVQFKSPGMFSGYFKDEEKTKEALTPDGYVKTGDAGFFDEKTGHLKIIDRSKDVGKLNDGTLVPAEIHRKQAQVLPQYPRGGGLRRQARLRRRDAQHRLDRGGQLGRTQQRGLRLLSGTRRPPAGLRHDRESMSPR